ncbi:MAG TPA: phage holin family protein [Steroidobacteraceae bacterium]|jgi:putative membrane protein|nr:phage holin family protein [Steroidobacteraceae bacterium]
MIGFLFRAVLAALGLWIATRWVRGIYIDTPTTLVLAGLLLGVVNAVVRPIAVILTFPFTVLTLGLFLLVVNAMMLGLVAALLPGFHVSGFWAAFFAALIVSITGWIGSLLFGTHARVEFYRRKW